MLYTRSLILFWLFLGFLHEPANAVSRIKLVAATPQALSVSLTWEWRGAHIGRSGKLDIQWSNCNTAFNPLVTFSSPPRVGTLSVTVPTTGEYCFRARASRSGRWVARTRALHVSLESLDTGDDLPPYNPDPSDGGSPTDPPPPPGSGWLVTPQVELAATLSECPSGFEQAALAEINVGRSAAGLSALQYSRDLWIAARMHASDMALNGVLSHTGWDRFFQRTAFNWIAQNIAVNIGDGVSLARAWLESPPHRASILDPRAHFAGIACVADANGAFWSTQYLASAAAPA